MKKKYVKYKTIILKAKEKKEKASTEGKKKKTLHKESKHEESDSSFMSNEDWNL